MLYKTSNRTFSTSIGSISISGCGYSCIMQEVVKLLETDEGWSVLHSSPHLLCDNSELARQHCVTEIVYCNTIIPNECDCHFRWLYWRNIRDIVHFIVYCE